MAESSEELELGVGGLFALVFRALLGTSCVRRAGFLTGVFLVMPRARRGTSRRRGAVRLLVRLLMIGRLISNARFVAVGTSVFCSFEGLM